MKRSILLSAAAMIAAPSLAAAQEAASSDSWVSEVQITGRSEGLTSPVAETATRTPTPLMETAQSVQVLTGTLIEEQDLTSISDALKNVSGVSPSTTMEAVLQAPLIRGFPANYYFDGLPTYGLPPGSMDPGSLVNVERIEVAKGPTSTLYGGGAGAPLAGLINVVSRDPGDVLTGAVSFRLGSYSALGVTGEIEAPVGNGALSLRIAGAYDSSDSYIRVVDLRRSALYGGLKWAITANTDLTLRAQYTRIEQREYSGLPAELTVSPALIIDPYAFAGAEDAPRTFSENTLVTLSMRHRFSDRLWLDVSVRQFEGRSDEFSTYPIAQFLGTTYFFGSGRLPSDVSKTFLTASIYGEFSAGVFDHRVLLGADYDNTDYDAGMGLDFGWGVIDYADPTTNSSYGVAPAISDIQSDRLRSGAVYVQDQLGIGDRLDITLGLRWTRLTVRSTYTSFGIPFLDTDKTYEKLTPRIGATFALNSWISAFAGYGEGFYGTVAAFGVADPQPETSRSYEVGLKFNNRTVGLSGAVAIYDLARRNVITADPSNPFASIQTGEQRARGAELDMVYEPSRSISVLLSYAYTDARVTKDNTLPVGDRLRRIPSNAGRIAARYRFEGGTLNGLEVGAGVTAVSARELTLPNDVSVKGRALLDFQASYAFGPAILSLSIVNLTGESGFEPYQYFAGPYVIPTQPRSAFVALRARF